MAKVKTVASYLNWTYKSSSQWCRYSNGYTTSHGDPYRPLNYGTFEARYGTRDEPTSQWFIFPDAFFTELSRDLMGCLTTAPFGPSAAAFAELRDAVMSCDNRARSRFVEKARGVASVQIGETLAQGGDMLGIIIKRATTLSNAYRHLRRGNLRKFFTEFGVPTPFDKDFRPFHRNRVTSSKLRTPPTWTGGAYDWGRPSQRNRWKDRSRYFWAQSQLKAKDVGSVWLEYWFVWAPVVSDLHGALKILCDGSPPHGQTVRTTASRHVSYRQVYPYYSGTLFDIKYGAEVKISTLLQGRVRASNPNRQLLDMMGISNIPLLLWWVTPFSFLVDWVVNVSEVLESYQDTMDWYLDDGIHTNYVRTAAPGAGRNAQMTGWASYTSHYSSQPSENYTAQCVVVSRKVGVGIPEVHLIYGLPKLSLTRAATAISLLAQTLKSI